MEIQFRLADKQIILDIDPWQEQRYYETAARRRLNRSTVPSLLNIRSRSATHRNHGSRRHDATGAPRRRRSHPHEHSRSPPHTRTKLPYSTSRYTAA
ncbi:hypothetical protein J6590_047739 [Homalodisca vitripennis]|nr:hypothetical protein J6590_047739 [Homalodisca vitripennis]